MSTSYIHLIRHGITEGNQKNWIYGELDIPLAPEGIAELEKLCAEGIHPHFEDAEYWTTGLRRTEQTLELLYGTQPHKAIPEMQEIHFGIYEGLTFTERKGDPVFDRWVHDKTGTVVPEGGESFHQFRDRVYSGFEELLSRRNPDAKHTVLVCHGGPIGLVHLKYFPGGYCQEDVFNMYKFLRQPGHGITMKIENHNFTEVSYF